MGTMKTICAFMAGAAAGVAAALLIAPESGTQTRERLRKGASDVAGMAKDKIIEGLDILETALEEK